MDIDDIEIVGNEKEYVKSGLNVLFSSNIFMNVQSVPAYACDTVTPISRRLSTCQLRARLNEEEVSFSNEEEKNRAIFIDAEYPHSIEVVGFQGKDISNSQFCNENELTFKLVGYDFVYKIQIGDWKSE